MAEQFRHVVAKWSPRLSLGGRLSILLVTVVTAVVTTVAYLEVRSFTQSIERELLEASRSTAFAVAENLGAHQPVLDELDVRDTLHEFAMADPLVDAISVIETEADETPRVVTSTSTEERAQVVALAAGVAGTNEPASEREDTVVSFAVPVPHQPGRVVAVTVGLESLLQARAHGARIALGFALPTVLLLALVVYFFVRRLVERPIVAILQTMEATASGDLQARAPIDRQDEVGTIATGLNTMLDRLEELNRSQLFELREALARAERVAALGQAAANVAHQVGTPLNLVSGYVQMLREDTRVDARVRVRLQTIDAQIQQVTQVLRTMLDHARQPSGFELVRLGDVIDRVRDLASAQLSRSGIELHLAAARDLPCITGDATQLEMALLNLVTNALDAMPSGGVLSIAASRRPMGIRLEIADSGPGIPSYVLDRIFEPWVTTKPAGRGTGLGLAIVQNVIRAHGGSVSASNPPSGGALFVIELPASRCHQEEPAP